MANPIDLTPEERWLYNRQFDHPGGGEELTKQADKDSTDVNIIVRTYGVNGAFAHINPLEPRYQDNTQVVDLITAKNLVNSAMEEFMKLPAEVRAAANNDPVRFLEMLTDEKSVKALKEFGLPFKEEEKRSLTESLLEKVVANTTPKESPEKG